MLKTSESPFNVKKLFFKVEIFLLMITDTIYQNEANEEEIKF